jgi:uncharacterized protein
MIGSRSAAEEIDVAHPNEALIRRIYASFARGDMGEVLADCTDDVVFEVPGHSRVAGTYPGRDGFLSGLLPSLAAVADMSTFSEDIDAVACDDDHGVLLATQRFRRHDGRQVEYRSAVVFGFRDGRMSHFAERPGNQAEYDDAWS